MNFKIEKDESGRKVFLDHQSKFEKRLFQSMMKVFERSENYSSFRVSKYYFVLLYVILYLQFSSLQWRPGMNLKDWNYFQVYWEVFSFARIDTLVYKFDLQFPAYLFLSACIYVTFALISIIFAFAVKKKEPPRIICVVVGKLLKVESSVLLIPILTFYSVTLSQFISYSQFYPSEVPLPLSSFYMINTVFCLILHLFHIFITESMSVELRHSFRGKVFEAKASCSIDLKRVLSRVIIVQLYCYFSSSNIVWLHLMCCVVCSWLGSMYILYIPYYNKAPNFITFTKISCEFVTSVSFLVARYLDSSSFLLLFNLFVVPLVGYLSFEVVTWRYKHLAGLKFEDIGNPLLVEIFLRQELCKSEGNSSIIEKFTRFSQQKKHDLGLIAIWECNYCIYSLEDFRLAYIKLAKVKKSNFSFEISFQEFKCFKILKENGRDLLEDLNFLNYIFKLTRAKQVDRTIAKAYVNFLTEIVSAEPSVIALEEYLAALYQHLKSLKRSYESLCSKYHKGNESRKLWTTFNEDIFEYADPLTISKLKYKETDKIFMNVINYFDESNGIMLVSAEKETAGNILYVNEQFARLIEGNVHTLTNTQLNTLIPVPYSNEHNSFLVNYADRCIKSSVDFPSALFLLTDRGFLVECFLSISCASLNCHTFYLVLTKKMANCRQIALINSEGLIYEHSENLKFFISNQRTTFKKSFIQEYLPNLDLQALHAGIPHEYKDKNHDFFIVKTIKTIGKREIILLNFVKDERGLSEFMQLEKTEMIDENEGSLFNTIKNMTFEKGKVRFDKNDPADENTEYFHVLEERDKDKTRSDSTGLKLDGVVLAMNKGLFYGIKYVRIVKWMMIGIMVISVCSNAIYVYFINDQVTLANDDYLIEHFGSLISFVLSSATSVNYLQLSIDLNLDHLQIMKQASDKVTDLDDKIKSEKGTWSQCHRISRIFSKDYLKVLSSDRPDPIKMNLQNFFLKFKENTDSFIRKAEKKINNDYEMQFILNNSVVFIVDQLEKDLDDIRLCGNQWLGEFRKMKEILLAIQIIVVFSYFFLMVYESYKITEINNFVWNKISESTYHSFYDIRNKCIHRLTSLLDTNEEEANLLFDCNRVKINQFPVKFRQMWMYLWRIGIFVLISALYFVVLAVVVGTDIETAISRHNDLKILLYQKVFLTQKTEFFTISPYFNYFPKDFTDERFFKLMDQYYGIDHQLMSEKYLDSFHQNTDDYLLKYYNRSITHGLLNHDKIVRLDSFYLYSTNYSSGINSYSIRVNELYNLNLKIIDLINKSSKDLINSKYKTIITGIIVFSLFYILIYGFFYWPYFNKKMNQMRKMKKLCPIFMSSDLTSHTNDKSMKSHNKN